MRRRWGWAALALIGMALPLTASATSSSLRFGRPVQVNHDGWGYEPSIDVDSKGTLYVTAHKGAVTNEGTRLSSFLWSSRDHGASWREMSSPDHLTESQFSFEGDIAVDAKDRLYFVDTYGPDTWLSRWSKAGARERSAPAVTASIFDDRPWIAAQGDNVVWLLTTDIATHALANGIPDPAAGSGGLQSAVLYRSADGGVTWSLGTAFPHAQYCGLTASSRDLHAVAVACVVRTASGKQQLVAFTSADSGASWTQRTVFSYRGRADSFISIAYDQGGALVTAFAEALSAGHRLRVAHGLRGSWAVRDVTPLRGAFQHVWVAADGKGRLGLAFYATSSRTPTPASEWYVYAGAARSSRGAMGGWSFARLDKHAVVRGIAAPADFLQCVIGPDGRLYVAYSRAPVATDLLHALPPDFDHDIFVVRQAS